jgi:ATP-dependent helicase HrpA
MPSRPKPTPNFRIEFPPELPISARADEIVGLLQQHQVIVLAGETGSGKTTQIPKMVLAAGGGTRGRIACTQPRRVAAASVSRRVAEELNVEWGREVGCKIRFADQTSPETVVKFMTDGMLLAELQGDPELRDYDAIIVDEAHERSLNIDFILGHLRRLRVRRPDLKIVITSATIDTKAFSDAFDGAPIVEVSGRTYPVEVIYAPLDEMDEAAAPEGPAGRAGESKRVPPNRNDEFTYIDGAVEAVERVLHESASGDVLVFLPTERDIREVRDLLEGRRSRDLEVVPLFGRLTNAEQQRVFAPTQKRKIVVATNIAETSLTIPGIRFVIDTGLARISRYVPQSRTRRLPVEPVAQSSADQRKGRCGRVSNGVCIRLYSEQDFNERPRFAQPEIQRSNLADVILRMKAFGLGDIEEFPFLNAPPAKGIRAGYALLHELGAIDEAGVLTGLGRDLAHLPVDPTVGRMVLQARTEKCMREVLVIAAALSIQDPRERPLDAPQKADAAHRRFTHPDSDFLTLLAIWEAYHDDFETMTLGKLRKFCTSHYLSFMRMREWRDVHAQLVDVIEGREGFEDSSVFDGVGAAAGPSREETRAARRRAAATPESVRDLAMGTPGFRAIHRSILAGLLGNIATRTEDGTYHAAHDRKVAIFPGSALFEKPAREKVVAPRKEAPAKPKVARWIMASEIMETGRVYARTCARIDPHWALDLGAHLLRVSHSEPFWSPESGRVLVKERRRLYNLELETRSVGYGKINPREATEIFIREGLVGDTVTFPLDFIAHNRRVREQAENVLTRLRAAGYMNLDEAVYRFYARRLLPEAATPSGGGGGTVAPSDPGAEAARAVEGSRPYRGVSSVPELVDFVRHRQTTEPKFLFLGEDDLKLPGEDKPDDAAFPEQVALENRALPLNYAYKPGQEDDGVTLRVSLPEVAHLTPATLDWAVPGHLREKIELLLKALPKEQRRTLIPLADTAGKITREIQLIAAREPQPTLRQALAEILTQKLGVRIDPRLWEGKALPDHLRVRVEVIDQRGAVLGAGRELAELQRQLGTKQREVSQRAARTDSAAWRAAREKWETPPATEWKFGSVPDAVVVTEQAGVPVRAYPGLQAGEAGVAVRLFATPEEARAATRGGLRRLFETALRYELGWLEKDLRDLRAIGTLAVTLTPLEQLQADALDSIRRGVTGRAVQPLTAAKFEAEVGAAKADLRGLVPKLTDWLRETLTLRLALQTHKTPYPGLEHDHGALLPPDFLRRTPFARLKELPRYLKGMQARAERWKRDPAKDASRARELQPFVQAVVRLGDRAGDFRWMVEEFRVSLFAQELGTAEPVSAVRLEKALRDLAANRGDAPAPAAEEKPKVALPLPVKGKTVLKSLDALGNLPR